MTAGDGEGGVLDAAGDSEARRMRQAPSHVLQKPRPSHDQCVSADHTAAQIALAGSERVQVSEDGGQRLDWRGPSERAVRPVFVVVGLSRNTCRRCRGSQIGLRLTRGWSVQHGKPRVGRK